MQSRTYKLIIFDLDGPILDSFEIAKISLMAVRKKLAPKNEKLKELDDELIIKHWGYPGNVVLKRILPGIKEKNLITAIQTWKDREKNKGIPLIKGTVKTLNWVKKKGYLTCLLTSRSINLKRHLVHLNMEKSFDLVQSWFSLKHPLASKEKVHKNHSFSAFYKPQIGVLNQILEWARQKNISRSEILMIDDTLVGLKTAQRTKIDFLGVCTGPLYSKQIWQKYGNLNKKHIIKSIAELPNWLERNMRT